MSTITVKNVTKTFKNTTALENVNLTVKENTIYGLLGRNGAGKSTLLNLISNRLFPTQGEILIDGEPVTENDSALSKLYCMSEAPLYSEDMRVKEIIRQTKYFYPDFNFEYADALVKKFELNANKKVKELSTGYNSIFKIIIALSCGAPIILFDEPVLGLDANHRELFYKELIALYSEKPRTIIISTHIIEEVSDIIELAVIIKDGRIIVDDSVENIKESGYTASGKASDIDMFIKDKEVISSEILGGLKSVAVLGKRPSAAPDGIEITAVNLQEMFINLTNA